MSCMTPGKLFVASRLGSYVLACVFWLHAMCAMCMHWLIVVKLCLTPGKLLVAVPLGCFLCMMFDGSHSYVLHTPREAMFECYVLACVFGCRQCALCACIASSLCIHVCVSSMGRYVLHDPWETIGCTTPGKLCVA